MPSAPSRPCNHAGCPELVTTDAYCPTHRAARQRAYDDRRGSPSARGYDRAWRSFVRWYRFGGGLDTTADDYPERLRARNRCAACGSSEHLEFDHIQPLRQGGARLDAANVQPLCSSCHARKRAEESLAVSA